MIIKTQSLTARALDWAVGVAVGLELKVIDGDCFAKNSSGVFVREYSPTTNWGQLGPIISSLDVFIIPIDGKTWGAGVEDYYMEFESPAIGGEGPTPQIAACRAIVCSALGEIVDIPEVLL